LLSCLIVCLVVVGLTSCLRVFGVCFVICGVGLLVCVYYNSVALILLIVVFEGVVFLVLVVWCSVLTILVECRFVFVAWMWYGGFLLFWWFVVCGRFWCFLYFWLFGWF